MPVNGKVDKILGKYREADNTDTSNLVPYTGATSDVDLGSNNLTCEKVIVNQETNENARLNIRVDSDSEESVNIYDDDVLIGKIFQENDHVFFGKKTTLQVIHKGNAAYKGELTSRAGGPELKLQSLILKGGGSNVLSLSGLNVLDVSQSKIQLRSVVNIGNHSGDGTGLTHTGGVNELRVCGWSNKSVLRDFLARDIKCNQDFFIQNSHTPSSATDTGTKGNIAWDSSYLYVCVATNTWKRITLNTW